MDLYRRFSSLCLKWPKDTTKAGRDYGEFFRTQFSKHFPHGQQTHVKNAKELDRALGSLERLADNKYYNENPLKRSSATGLEGWACREAISNEAMKLIDEDESSMINRLKNVLNVRFSLSKADTRGSTSN